MYLTATPLNALSLTPLLLSIGLSIDYCTHLAHAFADGSADTRPEERTRVALLSRARAVAAGAFSTFIATSLLSCGRTLIMQTFFIMFSGVAVVGTYHALVVLPVCLSLLPFQAAAGEPDGWGMRARNSVSKRDRRREPRLCEPDDCSSAEPADVAADKVSAHFEDMLDTATRRAAGALQPDIDESPMVRERTRPGSEEDWEVDLDTAASTPLQASPATTSTSVCSLSASSAEQASGAGHGDEDLDGERDGVRRFLEARLSQGEHHDPEAASPFDEIERALVSERALVTSTPPRTVMAPARTLEQSIEDEETWHL